MRCPGCGVELNRKALKAGSCLQCSYVLPIVGRNRPQKVHNDTVRMPVPGESFAPAPPPPPAPGKKVHIPPPSRKPLILGKNAMDGQQEFSIGEVEASVHDDAPVPSVPSVSTADPSLAEIVARSHRASIERSRDRLPPPPPPAAALPPAYDIPGIARRPERKRRDTEQTLRMEAIYPPPPAPRNSGMLVDLILVLGIILVTLILTTILIFILK